MRAAWMLGLPDITTFCATKSVKPIERCETLNSQCPFHEQEKKCWMINLKPDSVYKIEKSRSNKDATSVSSAERYGEKNE